MTDLMDILYSYAQDHEIASMLAQDDGYRESERCVQGQERRVRAALGEAGGMLDGLLEEQKLLRIYQEGACFRAGFRVALELTR